MTGPVLICKPIRGLPLGEGRHRKLLAWALPSQPTRSKVIGKPFSKRYLFVASQVQGATHGRSAISRAKSWRVHPDRTRGGHRHHGDSDGAAAGGRAEGTRSSQPLELRE